MNNPATYQYKVPTTLIILGFIFLGACSYLLWQKLKRNKVPLDSIFRLSENGVSMLDWLVFVVAVFVIFITMLAFFQRLKSEDRSFKIYSDYFVIPQILFSKEKKVYFESVTNIKETEILGIKTVTYITPEGKASVLNWPFKTDLNFLNVKTIIKIRCDTTRILNSKKNNNSNALKEK